MIKCTCVDFILSFLQLTDDELNVVKKQVLQKAIDGLNTEGFPFVGKYV